MKITGMIRKIDELGRIVIPKEIRKILRLKTDQHLEIFLNNDEVILKKYFPIKGVSEEVNIYFSVFSDQIKLPIFVTDDEKIILADKQFRNTINESINEEIINLIEKRKTYESQEVEEKQLFNLLKLKGFFYILPIIICGDCEGAAIVVSQDQEELNQKKEYIELLVKLIVKTLEN